MGRGIASPPAPLPRGRGERPVVAGWWARRAFWAAFRPSLSPNPLSLPILGERGGFWLGDEKERAWLPLPSPRIGRRKGGGGMVDGRKVAQRPSPCRRESTMAIAPLPRGRGVGVRRSGARAQRPAGKPARPSHSVNGNPVQCICHIDTTWAARYATGNSKIYKNSTIPTPARVGEPDKRDVGQPSRPVRFPSNTQSIRGRATAAGSARGARSCRVWMIGRGGIFRGAHS